MSLRALERPAAGEPEGALVLFHGRGADEHDLFPLLDALDPERRLHGYTPRGPLVAAARRRALVRRAARRLSRTRRRSREGYAALAEWLDALPFPAERIVLGGFSQGAVMSYALGLGKGRPRPAALLALSGFIPTVEGWEPDLEPPFPPIAIVHGDVRPGDPGRVRPRRARARSRRRAPSVLYRESPVDHTIDPSVAPRAPPSGRRGCIPSRLLALGSIKEEQCESSIVSRRAAGRCRGTRRRWVGRCEPARRHVQVLHRPTFPPMELATASGKITGFDVDMAQALALTWGANATPVEDGVPGAHPRAEREEVRRRDQRHLHHARPHQAGRRGRRTCTRTA